MVQLHIIDSGLSVDNEATRPPTRKVGGAARTKKKRGGLFSEQSASKSQRRRTASTSNLSRDATKPAVQRRSSGRTTLHTRQVPVTFATQTGTQPADRRRRLSLAADVRPVSRVEDGAGEKAGTACGLQPSNLPQAHENDIPNLHRFVAGRKQQPPTPVTVLATSPEGTRQSSVEPRIKPNDTKCTSHRQRSREDAAAPSDASYQRTAKPSPEQSAPCQHTGRAAGSACTVHGFMTSSASLYSSGLLGERVDHVQASGLFATADFPALGLDASLCKHLALRLGWKRPTQIQERTIPSLVKPSLAWARDFSLPVWSLRARTGTGKTAAYLLPIIHGLLQARPRVDRSDGTVAMILAPTRELCVQIEEMARVLLRPYHWIVVSAFVGGEKRKAEKGRLRHGTSLVVGTPARLWDHLQHTSSWNLSSCRWFVLDEADRMLEMGMAETAKELWAAVQERSQRASEVATHSDSGAGSDSFAVFRTVLVSATMRADVASVLWGSPAPTSIERLSQRIVLYSIDDDATDDGTDATVASSTALLASPKTAEITVTTPPVSSEVSGLSGSAIVHFYTFIPTKFRLAGLAALLHGLGRNNSRLFSHHEPSGLVNSDSPTPNKALVFFSTCAAVDFHFEIFRNWDAAKAMLPASTTTATSPHSKIDTSAGASVTFSSWLNCFLFRIHGSMLQAERVRMFRLFRSHQPKPCLLLCTDVAARGLDIRDLYLSIQYDPPTTDGDQEYWHRVGRTSRLGSAGVSITLLQPHEYDYVPWMHSKYGVAWHSLLLSSFTRLIPDEWPPGSTFSPGSSDEDKSEEMGTGTLLPLLEHIQHLVETIPGLQKLAVDAFYAYVRSYRTHAREMRQIFNARLVHLGHLAESFGLDTVPGRKRASDDTGKMTTKLSRSHSSRQKRSLNATAEAAAEAREALWRRPPRSTALPSVDRKSEFLA
jgi:ATP-dependent RNA helicase DDX31/DBP7